MSKPCSITLDGKTYAIKKLTIGQLERVQDVFTEVKPSMIARAIITIAMERADPPVELDLENVETDIPELSEAMKQVLLSAGLNVDKIIADATDAPKNLTPPAVPAPG